jgi:hypothetical protein
VRGLSSSGERGGLGTRLLVFLVVIFAGAALAWMLFLPLVLTTQIRQRTGFDAAVQSVVLNPFTGTVQLRGLILTNPPTYPVHDFLELRQFTADAEVFTMFSDRPVFSTMEVDVARVTVVKRDGSQTNAAAFSDYLTTTVPDGPPRAGPARVFLIRRLTVKIDEVIVADHTGRAPVVQNYKLSFNQCYADVTGVKQLLAPPTLQALLPLGTALNGLLPGAIGKAVGEAVRDATKTSGTLLRDAGRNTSEKIKGYFDALEESKKP